MVRFGAALIAVLLLPTVAFADDETFFDEGRAQAALERIFDKAGHPTKVLSLVIRAHELAVELQDPSQPGHIDAWQDSLATSTFRRWVYPEWISGPRPVELSLPNPNLDANLLDLKPSDAAVVPKLVADAVKRAQLEDAARVDRLELRRQLHLVPEPSSGPPQWDVEVTSGRERATIYADQSGRLTHANFDGTRRAQALNYLNGGKELTTAVAMIADTLGKDPIIKSMIVYDKSLTFEAVNPDHPDRDARFSAGLNGVYRDLLLDSVTNINLPNQPTPGRFAITDVDWSLLPKLEDTARDRLKLPGGKIGLVQLSKPSNGVGGPTIEWEINVKAADDAVVEGYVVFDVKGNVLRTKFPPGRGPKLDMLDAASIAPAFDALKSALGEHAAMTELEFRSERLMITTRDPKDPAERLVFDYSGESLRHSIMPPLDWPTFGPDWFFDLSQAQPVAARWSQLQQDALTRLGLADGKIERMTISKQKLLMPRNDRVLVEVRAEAGKRNGYVVYDLNGRPVEIVKP